VTGTDLAAVAGIDRWRGGWIVAELSGTSVSLSTAATVEPLIEQLAAHAAVAIDMPIALAVHGRRQAEAEVRAVLGASARSVFTSPTRAAVQATSRSQATTVNRANGGPGISAQAFGLFASICELRTVLSAEQCDHWWETHPETSFATVNGGTPLASKKTARGVGERLTLLRPLIDDLDALLAGAPAKVPVDDVLDAIAAAWSARRIANGTADVYGEPERDDEGFALGIRV